MAEGGERFELTKRHHEDQNKYTYFLLAGAASGIAFAITKTEGQLLSWWLLPAGLSVLCWAVSFYAGCRAVQWTQACVGANYSLLSLQAGVHPNQTLHPQAVAAAVRGVEKALDGNAKKVELWARVQFRCLVGGGVLFVAWRVAELIRASTNAA